MEINLAFAEMERAFAGQPHRPLRRSKKNDHEGPLVELSFVSPEVGARYAAVIEELEQATHWRVRVAASVDQQTVLATVRSLLPPTWRLTRDPGLDVAGRKVRLQLSGPPPAAEWAALEAALREATGFGLA
ncbi:MAG: hypothetical protein FJ125_11305 [Deltaproteobacteria bacterium]|nr:hypothetical protein [Deltaproteobacteria bacterium]